MTSLLGPQTKKRKLQYDRANLQKAYAATQSGISVYRAARQFSVPESTLRDRTLGLVDLNVTIGFDSIFNKEEEQKLVNHITYMAQIGYGYSKSSIQYMAKDYAESLGKTVKAKQSLSNNWFYGFIKRWPSLKVVKPQKLSISRAKSASRETINNYYKELGTILTTNRLEINPQNIYNIDETGVNSEHSPPKIVCDKNTVPQNITSPRSSTITVIAGGNAVGSSIPPYYIFPGQRWSDDFLNGACPGSAGEMTKTGWSNSQVFQNYLTKHFVKFVKFSENPILILYDGHRSHISLTLTEWARRNNVILFVLPPHSSHITQPLDVGVFGPFKTMYYSECQSYMKKHPGMNITKYDIAELTSRPYLKALSPDNLISAFRKTGIHPFNSQAITESQVAPSVIYSKETDEELGQKQPSGDSEKEVAEHAPTMTDNQPDPDQQEAHLSNSHVEKNPNRAPKSLDFFQSRTITKAIVKKPKAKFVPPFLAGNLLKKSNTDILNASKQNNKVQQAKPNIKQSIKKTPTEKTLTKSQTTKICPVKQTSAKKLMKDMVSSTKANDPQPSTSGLNKRGRPLNLTPEDQEDSDSEIDIAESEKCCVCHRWEPADLKDCIYVGLVNWGECNFCQHWTHLKFCTDVRVLRRDSVFRCPHCLNKNF